METDTPGMFDSESHSNTIHAKGNPRAARPAGAARNGLLSCCGVAEDPCLDLQPDPVTGWYAVAEPTLHAVCNWYHIHPRFARGVLETLVGPDYDRDIGDIHQLLARYAPSRVYLEYAFATNQRGRETVRQLIEWGVPIAENTDGGSFLDIGFAYGGLLSAFASRGYETTGIEIAEKFGRLGRLNLAAAGCTPHLLMGDFLAADVLPGEAQFDMITCIDVIEHVQDPEACLRKICRLLKPGGTAYVAVPSKLSMASVRSDVHTFRFGLTLLDYFRAREATVMYSGQQHYGVTDFYEPEWYVNTVQAAGAAAELRYETPPQPWDIPGEIAALYTAFAEWNRSQSKALSALMRHEIQREFAAYSARMFEDYSKHVRLNAQEQFARKWIDQLTRVLIHKPGQSDAPGGAAE
jgi:2-polyprenyl-3-methyl-5-hydroxy-6-metoxy-1,4-benzoquinol methylase